MVLYIDSFQSQDKTAMLVNKTIVKLPHALHNNSVQFPKDFFLLWSVHQLAGDDVSWKPPNGYFYVFPFSQPKYFEKWWTTEQTSKYGMCLNLEH